MPSPRRLLDDCFLHDKDRLKHAEALAILKQRIHPVCQRETVALEAANGRILAEAILAPRNVPLTDNAAVDGYAFRHDDLLTAQGFLPVSNRIAAGDTARLPLEANSAARIFTGAVMPEGADTVVMQEDCALTQSMDGGGVEIPIAIKPGANCRKAGEDLNAGATVVNSGNRLRAQELAAIASLGYGEIDVYAPLKVALVSTGDEILRPGAAIRPGQVYDSNFYLLNALLEPLPVTVDDLGVLADKPDQVQNVLVDICQQYDVVLTSGGASRGEEDHLITAIDALGSRHMWQLAIKPGRPMSFGQVNDCVIMALPGNPVAVMVCFLLYVYPMLLRMAGGAWSAPRRYAIPAAFEIVSKKPDRREFLRGSFEEDEQGNLRVRKFARDGSGLITGLREADGLIEIPEATTRVQTGDTVSFIPFTEFGLPARLQATNAD